MAVDSSRTDDREVVCDRSNSMAEGTRLKQLETWMEVLDFGMSQMQEAMIQSREDMAVINDSIGELEKGKETVEQYGLKINSMFNMLAALPQFSLLPYFPP